MQSCTNCIHRPYGEQRRYTDCLVIEPFWSRKKPHPKSFGALCKRFEEVSGLEHLPSPPANPEQSLQPSIPPIPTS